MTGRVGFGLGGGVSYTPDGGIPGPIPQDPSAGGVVLSCSGKANFNAGPLTAYLEKGIARNYSSAESALLRRRRLQWPRQILGPERIRLSWRANHNLFG